jgi:hypothetical protein
VGLKDTAALLYLLLSLLVVVVVMGHRRHLCGCTTHVGQVQALVQVCDEAV